MDLIQFSITFLIAFFLGVTLTLLIDTIKTNLLKFYKVWTFRHKALVPFEPSEKNNNQVDEDPSSRVD